MYLNVTKISIKHIMPSHCTVMIYNKLPNLCDWLSFPLSIKMKNKNLKSNTDHQLSKYPLHLVDNVVMKQAVTQLGCTVHLELHTYR